MPTFKVRQFVLLGLTFLGGCLAPEIDATRNAPKSISVTDAAIIVTGPPGYCVDLEASRSQPKSAFVLMASCASISNTPLMPQPSLPAILTASIAQGISTTPRALDSFFRSPAGIATLRNQGPVESMRLSTNESALFVFTDGPKGDQWRGLVPLDNGVLVTISLQETGPKPMSAEDRFAELGQFASKIVGANSIHSGGGS